MHTIPENPDKKLGIKKRKQGNEKYIVVKSLPCSL